MSENIKGNNEILLKDVPKRLRGARKVAKNVPYELHDLCDYLADVANEELYPDGMIVLLACALDDLEKEQCGFSKEIPFPEDLKSKKFHILIYLSYFPLIVDKIANKEFAEEFRKRFMIVFGEAQPPEVNTKEDFGVKIVREGVVDISNKDKAEVLVELYNNSHPQGLGFLQYSSSPMTIDEARELLKRQTYFDYLAGRVMKISLETDEIYTWGYNRDNGDGAAERAISHCRNIK